MKIDKNWAKLIYFSEKDTFLTTDEAIEYLKISKPTFLKYIRLGRIELLKQETAEGCFNQNSIVFKREKKIIK